MLIVLCWLPKLLSVHMVKKISVYLFFNTAIFNLIAEMKKGLTVKMRRTDIPGNYT